MNFKLLLLPVIFLSISALAQQNERYNKLTPAEKEALIGDAEPEELQSCPIGDDNRARLLEKLSASSRKPFDLLNGQRSTIEANSNKDRNKKREKNQSLTCGRNFKLDPKDEKYLILKNRQMRKIPNNPNANAVRPAQTASAPMAER